MKLLFTTDLQTEHNNLDLCTQSWDQLLRAARKYQPDAIVFLGDGKERYQPEIMTVKWWVRAVRRVREAGFRFIYLLGNHDRISQSRESKNWLDILRAAGAETVSVPRVKQVGDGALAMLPFTSDKKEETVWAAELTEKSAEYPNRVLCFHTEISGFALNTSGTLTTGNSAEALFVEHYRAAFGGHVHMYQWAEHAGVPVWYVGSPFCHDWGEANSKKGHLYVEVGEAVTTKRLITKIPHWYDAEWLAENERVPEPGAYIRSKVTVTTKKISAQLNAEEKRLKDLYGEDARLYVVPQLERAAEGSIVLSGANDRENIESYVAATLPEAARFTAKAVVAYMVSHVQTTRSGPRQRPLWLNKITVHNVLCFRDLSIGYEKLGLVLLKGINRDWPGQSNGAGKTSVLSMLPLIWFGQTLKGQKNDEWKQEDSDGEAWGVLTMRDERNRIIEIERGRPHRLLMRIDGKDVSAGVTGKGKTETQGRIEEETSFDYRTLISSVYIDQTVANGFLFGTQKDRMDLAGKLVDTSRFESAKQVVTKEIKTTEAASATAATRVEGHETLLSEIEDELAELKRQRGTGQWEARRKAAQKETARLRTLLAGYSASKEHYDEVERLISDAESELNQLRLKLPGAAGEVQSLLRELQRAKMLASSNKCTQCGQPVPKTVKAQRDTLQALYDAAALNQKKLTERQTSVQTVLAGAKKEVDHYHRSIERAETEKEAAELVVQQAMQGEKEEAAAFAKVDAKIAEAEHKAAHTRRLIKANQDIMQECDVQMEMLVYAGKAFSRTGIPMYLCRQMCDQLNQSADEYSEIFSEGRIQVQFSLDEDEFVATVVNSAGSAELSGQSVGESAMAGIITAFAIREAAPKTNLLILDEPGHGLDEKGQQLFATGLLKLKARWESIIVCTHSPVIQGILEGESTVWTVIKKNRVSRLKGL